MKYLKKFASLIPAIQGNKVVNRIDDKKNKGQIRSEQEYNKALQDVLSNISVSEVQPLFDFVPIRPGLSSSEHFNETVSLIKDDLDVIFLEINNIFTAIKAHSSLFTDKLIDELNYTLKELEGKEESLSLIGDPSNSFDDIYMNTFNGEKGMIEKTNPYANEILSDTRKKIKIEEKKFLHIDEKEKVATLPISNQEDIKFATASLRTAETTVTDKSIQLIDSRIDNILKLDSAASWAYNILKKKKMKNGAKLSLELDIGDKRKISFLDIHPISDFPMLLEKITYIDINNNEQDLPDDSVFNTSLEKPMRVSFPAILAKKIILKLSQTTSILFDYDDNSSELSFDDLKRGAKVDHNVEILTDVVKETIQDPDVIDSLPLKDKVKDSYSTYNQYVFGLKKATCGLTKFQNEGFLISKEQDKDEVGLIALDTVEDIPKVKDALNSIEEKMASFEYDIVKKDFNAAGELIDSKIFPVLPLNSTDVKKERLHFSNKEKVIPLRFRAHRSDSTAEHVKVFRDNVELVRGSDWRFFNRVDLNNDSDDRVLTSMEKTNIEILHDQDVLRTGIYTADYVPRYIEEPHSKIEENGIVYLPSGVTEHKSSKGIDKVKKSKIFLKAALRNNSRTNEITPKLKLYKLMTASLKKNRYVRIK